MRQNPCARKVVQHLCRGLCCVLCRDPQRLQFQKQILLYAVVCLSARTACLPLIGSKRHGNPGRDQQPRAGEATEIPTMSISWRIL